MFARRTTLKQSIEIVSDPAAEEVKWLAACTLLGDKPVQLHKPSLVNRTTVLCATIVSSILSVLNCILAFAAFCFLSGYMFCGLTQMDINWFMRQTNFGQSGGLSLLMAGGAGFWAQAALRGHPVVLRLLQVSGLGLILWASIIGTVPYAVVSLLSIAAFFVVGSVLSKVFIKHLPNSFQLDRSMISHGIGSSVLGLLTTWLIYTAATTPRDPSPYSAPEPMSVCFMLGFFAFATMSPAVICASATKCPSRGGMAFLNLFFQTPLFLGMVLTTVLTGTAAAAAQFAPDAVNAVFQFFNLSALSPALHNYGAQFLLCMTAATLGCAGLTVAGSALGTEIAKSAAKSKAAPDA